MLWLGVDLTTTIPCLGVSQLLIFVTCNVFKIVWLELSHITRVSKTLHLFPFEHCSIFKTAFLVSKFLHSGYPDYLYLSFNLDLVFITQVKAKLMVCSTHSKRSSKPIYPSISTLISAFPGFSLWCYVSGLHDSFLLFFC